jgi:protein-glutamine gamma-glutamyltransferase
MNRAFLISIYSLTAVSGGMIAFAEEIPFPSGLTLPLAILAYFYNEKEQRLRIKTLWANVLGIAAFGIAATELLVAGYSEAGFAAEGRLLAGAHLLSYLVWIALFQDKHGRQYWWLMALGVMQVAVGAILSQHSLFGVLLLVYVFLALWTLSVFSLYQASYGFEVAGQSSAGMELPAALSGMGLSATAGLILGQPDEFRGAIQLDPNERWVNRRFVLGIITTSLLSIGVGAVFFVLIPRLWVGKQHEFNDEAGSSISKVTGFTDEVQLGEIGQILESNERVLEVRFSKADSLETLDVEETARKLGYDEPLFRGSVMGSYENGRWQVLPQSKDITELLPPRQLRGKIRQHYMVLDGSSRTLFGMHPVYATEFAEDQLLRPSMDVVTSILFRRDDDRKRKGNLEYVLYGDLPRRMSERSRIHRIRSFPAQRAQLEAMPEFVKLPAGLDRLTQLARQIAETANLFEASSAPLDMRIARAIEQRLQSSGEYKYSLSNEIVDPAIDPVEDFLFNRKQGHCEYSATAMALMLRAVDIPSRLVSGFKGGQTSGFSGAFVVEGRHAHAWVEAWGMEDVRSDSFCQSRQCC